MKGLLCLGLLLVSAAADAAVCGLDTGYAEFQTDAGARPRDAPPDMLKEPQLEAVSLTRGVGGAPGTCDGTGILVMALKWPRGGKYGQGNVGFEFRVLSATPAYAPFPAEPIRATGDKRHAELLFLWPDDAPARQKPLHLEVEVRAITRDYQRGPPARVVVDSADLDD